MRSAQAPFPSMQNVRKLIVPLVISLLWCSCSMPARRVALLLAGRWEGIAISHGAEMRIIIDFSDATGGLRAWMSFPEALGLGFAPSNIQDQAPRLHFEKKGPDSVMVFDGTRQDNLLTGTLHGDDLEASVSLRRTGPVPPPSYATEEVRFHNNEVTLVGTLLIPHTRGPHPAVVLIHGSSTPRREDWRAYGDLFARHGLAALIYDKRNFGADREHEQLYDLEDLAEDALAAVTLLKTRPDIKHEQIGLWGLSEGGMVAPIAAAKSKDVAFVVDVSGPGVTLAEFSLHQNISRLRAHGFSEADIKEAQGLMQRVDDYVRRRREKRISDPVILQSALDEAWTQSWAAQTTLPRHVPTLDEMRLLHRWRDLDLDPANYWERISIPVLALYGERDDRFPVQRSVERIDAALKRSENKDATIKVFPQADHEIMLPLACALTPKANGIGRALRPTSWRRCLIG